MTQKEIYIKLLDDYQKLTEEEKRSILIYKSALFYHINSISMINDLSEKNSFDILRNIENKNEFIKRYEIFKKRIFEHKNILIRQVAFKQIDFDDIYSFIDSIKKIFFIIENAKGKITLPDNLTVYRGCSYKDKIYDISKGNLISTTINPEITKKFLFKQEKNILYEIKLEKNTPVLVTPYSVVNIYDSEIDYLINRDEKQLKISSDENNSQQELIIFKDLLDFKLDSNKLFDEDNLELIRLSSNIKNMNNTHNNKSRLK